MTTTINRQKFKNILDDDLEFISDDDDDEILLAQCINNDIKNDAKDDVKNDPLYEIIPDEDGEPMTIPLLPNDNDLSVDNRNVVDDVINQEQHLSVKPQPGRNRRSVEAHKKRNRRRNNTFRSRRYHYYITRRLYHRFTMKSIRQILDQHHIDYTHIKTVDGTLVIDAKSDMIKERNQQRLPDEVFDRYHYYEHCRRSRYSS
jgi:hypothetical protein